MMWRYISAAVTAAGLLSSAVHARITEHRAIDSADARTITDACIALATKSGWKVHIAVLNQYGDLARFVGMDSATRTSGVLALGKARTVYRTGRATADVAKMDPSAQREFDAVAIAGGIPVLIDGVLAGVVAVSGAAPEQDVSCAQTGIDAAM